tara:strand:+ start:8668 stop:9354 length:687 start_codon:yes stop_codon:yes gene_type:complete
VQTKNTTADFFLDLSLKKKCPEITVSRKDQGYQLEHKEKNMNFILVLDDYEKIVSQNKSHIFNKIFKKRNLNILDCTGGFARDACIISSLGNKVTLIENNPIVSIILRDAIKNIQSNKIQTIFDKILVRFGNCLDFIRQTDKFYDYIYFDFMFNVSKSALPSKRDQFLRKITTNNIEINKEIIKETLQRKNCKIIIKEHIKSNDYMDLNIITTYKEKIVKYTLVDNNK